VSAPVAAEPAGGRPLAGRRGRRRAQGALRGRGAAGRGRLGLDGVDAR